MRRSLALVALAVTAAGCGLVSSYPRGAYFPLPGNPETVAVSRTLYRAAQAAGDDPERYSFALFSSGQVTGYAAEDATFYVSEALARLPQPRLDALIAQQVAHETLGHAGQRRALSISISAGFTVLGIAVPGLGLVDLVANPLIVRAFTRDQVIAADLKAVEILRGMGHEAPRRALADALRAAAAVNRPPRGGPLLAIEPALEDRLAALEPLEPVPAVALRAPAPDSRE
ncbi:MAG TPA: hypothetical protein DDZ42_19140 [Candidatus Rokubacteria bacterium]|nr:MAG: hypothetical protein A2050_16480 [Candidatus Rokubacteria bacterium GWA2_73_35]HBH03998.1 hypothetical protein [Candidatus Rokubacteria bacterium]